MKLYDIIKSRLTNINPIYNERQVAVMKKISIVAILLIAILTFTMLLSSCAIFAGVASVASIWSKAYNTMNSLESYESEVKIDLKLIYNTFTYRNIVQNTVIECNIDKEDYYFYQQTKNYVSSNTLGLDQNILSSEAYYNGNYFVTNKIDDQENKIYCPVSLEDYKTKYKKDIDAIELELESCENAEYVKNEDKTFSVKYSGFSKDALKTILKDFGLDRQSFGIDLNIVDLEVTYVIDSKFLTKSVNMNFVIAEGAAHAKDSYIKVDIAYSNYNSAEPKANRHQTEDYTLVDMQLLDEVDALLDELIGREEESFVSEIKQTKTHFGIADKLTEIDDVKYGTKNKKFFYEISAETSTGVKTTLRYKEGSRYSLVQGEHYPKYVTQTDEEAKTFIKGLLTSSYDRMNACGIEKQDDTYIIRCKPLEVSPYKQIYTNDGGSFKSVEQTITIKVAEGKIVKIDSVIESLGQKIYDVVAPIELEIATSINFK